MKPVQTETCNSIYTLKGCNDLPVTRYTNSTNGEEGVESCWELSPDEIKQVQETGKVYLYIQGSAVPPILLTTESMVYFEDTKQHLCESCSKEYPTCDGQPEFGDGFGNDNVFRCKGYEKEGESNDNADNK